MLVTSKPDFMAPIHLQRLEKWSLGNVRTSPPPVSTPPPLQGGNRHLAHEQ